MEKIIQELTITDENFEISRDYANNLILYKYTVKGDGYQHYVDIPEDIFENEVDIEVKTRFIEDKIYPSSVKTPMKAVVLLGLMQGSMDYQSALGFLSKTYIDNHTIDVEDVKKINDLHKENYFKLKDLAENNKN